MLVYAHTRLNEVLYKIPDSIPAARLGFKLGLIGEAYSRLNYMR